MDRSSDQNGAGTKLYLLMLIMPLCTGCVGLTSATPPPNFLPTVRFDHVAGIRRNRFWHDQCFDECIGQYHERAVQNGWQQHWRRANQRAL